MASLRAQTLINSYETNTWLIHNLVDGLSDEESLLQLPFPANCLNWILGHIIWRRNSALATLGQPELWDEAITSRYKSNSEPIMKEADARRFPALLADLDQSQKNLNEALKKATDVSLDEVVENDRGPKPVIEHLRGFHWHETYHIGQLEILRAFIMSKR